jgi:hypothetical protein
MIAPAMVVIREFDIETAFRTEVIEEMCGVSKDTNLIPRCSRRNKVCVSYVCQGLLDVCMGLQCVGQC